MIRMIHYNDDKWFGKQDGRSGLSPLHQAVTFLMIRMTIRMTPRMRIKFIIRSMIISEILKSACMLNAYAYQINISNG